MTTLLSRLQAVAQNLVFLWCCLVAIFVKTIWGMWSYKDLSQGDSTHYFALAHYFATRFQNDIAWSPVYTMFLGTIFAIAQDTYIAMIAHRILILALIVLLLFEVARRLLNPQLAFLITAWWIILPINHNALYEVHLFAVIPLLLTLYVSLKSQGTLGRALTVMCLIFVTLLVRNEYLIATSIFSLGCFIVDFVIPFRRDFATLKWRVFKPIWTYAGLAVIPLLMVVVIYQFAIYKFPYLREIMREKHELNVSQILSYNYQQRTGDTSFSPWNGYQDYMISHFGDDKLPMGEAFRKNPGEVSRHFYWNMKMFPAGVQVSLFNVRAGFQNPDYAITRHEPLRANILSALVISLFLLGVFSALTLKDKDKYKFLQDHLWTWFLMAAFTATTAVVVVMQRPRPSYMFMFTMICMIVLGVALTFILRRFRLETYFQALLPPLAIVIVAVVPMYWLNWAKTKKSRPILAQVRLFQESDVRLTRDELLAAVEHPVEITRYSAYPFPSVHLKSLLPTLPTLETFTATMEKEKARYVILPGSVRDQTMKRWAIEAPQPPNWRLLGETQDQGESYFLYDMKASPGSDRN